MAGTKHRLRIRRLAEVRDSGERLAKPTNRYWAWSRPHVAEEIDRLAEQMRHRGEAWGWPRQIHMHPIAPPNGTQKYDKCDEACLVLDAVPADQPLSQDELDREKVA